MFHIIGQLTKNKMDKICFRCKKKIGEKENYYSFTEFNNGEIINIDYAHRVCWDSFLKQLDTVDVANKMLRGMKTRLQETGVLPEQEVIL